MQTDAIVYLYQSLSILLERFREVLCFGQRRKHEQEVRMHPRRRVFDELRIAELRMSVRAQQSTLADLRQEMTRLRASRKR